MFRRFLRRMVKLILLAVLLAVIVPIALRGLMALRWRADTYTVETVPYRRAAIVFGAEVRRDGRLSAMLADRVATAVDLYRAGKVEVILMTGDNSRADYNEPGAMRAFAIEMGVPAEAIVLDYAGRRTYDSCYRARVIFGLREAILVSQNFHLDRALTLCNALGVQSVGVWADYQRPSGYSRRSIAYSWLREYPAMVVAVIDLLRRPEPILGEPLPIFPDEPIE